MGMKENTLTRIFQNATRLFVLIMVTYFAVMHQIKGVLAAPNAHVFCPFGGLESLYKLVASGGYIKKIFPATMVLLVGSILLTIVLNRAFCGWICPLGTLQTIFARIGKFFKIKKIRVSANIDKYLGYIKYVFLVFILYFTWKAGDLVYGYYDPWAAYAHLAAGFEELYNEFLIGSIFLLVGLIGSLWIPNNFCRYFCPMGAFLSIFSKFSPTKIYRNTSTCIDCKKCDRICPAQIEISTQPNVSSAQCLSCGDCVEACPVENTLKYNVRGKFPFRWFVYGAAALVLFFGTIVVSKSLDLWKTNFATAEEVVMDDSGIKNPYLIKGSMTLESVADEFEVPVEAFIEKFNLPADVNTGEMLKNIAQSNTLEVEDFRDFIVEYLQQEHPGLTFEQPASAESH